MYRPQKEGGVGPDGRSEAGSSSKVPHHHHLLTPISQSLVNLFFLSLDLGAKDVPIFNRTVGFFSPSTYEFFSCVFVTVNWFR